MPLGQTMGDNDPVSIDEQQDHSLLTGELEDATVRSENTADTPSQRVKKWMPSRPTVVAIAGGVILGVTLFVIPMPYVLESPGPTFNVVGSYRGTDLIAISGTDPDSGQSVAVEPSTETEDGVGQLRMVTVSQRGGPSARLNLAELVMGYFDSKSVLVPYEEEYPSDISQEEVDQAQSALMSNSQSTAEVAALESLGWDVPASVRVIQAVKGTNAEDSVQSGDLLVSLTDAQGVVHPIDRASTVFALVKTISAGTTLTLTVERDGEQVDIPITTVAAPEGHQGSRLGVYLSVEATLPFDIQFNLKDVGGPSAGMMFALGIIDRMTPGALAGTESIAGTGTMSYDGEVGAIGGIVQKMWGAKRDGASWFLAPSSNCDEVVGNVPEGLSVVSVSTLSEARTAVETIAAGQGDTLPTCE